MSHLSPGLPAILTIKQVAEVVNFNFFHVRKWTYRQAKPPVGWPNSHVIAGSRRYLKAELEDWLNSISNTKSDLSESNSIETRISVEPPSRRGRGRPRNDERG